MTPERLGFAARTSARALVICMATLLTAAVAQAAPVPSPDPISVTPAAVPADIAEIRMQPALGTFAMPVAPGQQKLTSALLANYVAHQQELADFHSFGLPSHGELTQTVLMGYIARGSLGGGNGALDAIASFTDPAETGPALTRSVLASYVEDGFMPTVKRVAIAKEERGCLAQAIYHEARGESAAGQLAVANIIVNRANSGRYPDSLCGVIYQNADKGRYRCQFTFACDGRSDAPRERRAWNRSLQLAKKVYVEFAQGEGVGALPKSALFYHTTSVRPSWANVYTKVAQIGSHIFYAPN